MKSGWWGLIMGIVGGLLASGIIVLVSSPPRGQPVQLQAPPSPHPITVHVTGAVRNPGVYQLAPGTHVHDAVTAAGGGLAEANLQSMNLAALLQDGQRIWVPGADEQDPEKQSTEQEQPQTGSSDNVLININTADQAELESLPGIGPVTAQKIIAYREANGAFPDIEAIQQVPGIGPGIFAKIKALISVENRP